MAVDDCSRLAYVELLADERAETSAAFLARTLAWLAERGITVRRVLTDNGSAYRSHGFAALCDAHALRHSRTRPYALCRERGVLFVVDGTTPAPTARPNASPDRPAGLGLGRP